MRKISVPYGSRSQEAVIGDDIELQVIDLEKVPVKKTSEQMLREALEQPIGSAKLEDLVKPEDQVLIIVNDHTRPGPYRIMVKEIVERLSKAGVMDSHIRFIIATGSHRASTRAEIAINIGEAYVDRFKVIVHCCTDSDSIVSIGQTQSGLPLYVNKAVVESSFIITTGLIVPHHTAGFSGGRKSIVPGVAGLETLRIHHSLPIRPAEPAMGYIYGNPFHEASLEAAKKVNVRFIVNAVQDPHKQDFAFVAGDMEAAHEAGVAVCRKASEVDIHGLADIVVTSPGGHPRDVSLYQAQKALSVAEMLGKPGCTYILVAQAEDGIGEGVFREWMVEAKTPEEVVERFKREGYNVGSNKAFMYARAMTKGRVMVVSENLKESDLNAMMFDWAPDLQTALDKAGIQKPGQKLIVLPRAVNIIPRVV